MVSLWPFKGNETSTAAFERTLSSLSGKISKTTTANASLKLRSRRFRALWTIYACFIYILYTLILVLVTGWKNWSAVEYTAIAAGPLVIYAVRAALSVYYDYRISHKQAYLDELQKQRATAVERYKTATRYNSTQQLLEKYGAEDESPKRTRTKGTSAATSQTTDTKGTSSRQPARTNMPPPPTANIRQASRDSSLTSQPDELSQSLASGSQTADVASSIPSNRQIIPSGYHSHAEFAPNAEPSSPQFLDRDGYQGRWYDRIMDVLLGDDENKPINRIALICSRCRLVNGQAPPGSKTAEDVGSWRCFNCQAWNGQESEVQEALNVATKERPTEGSKNGVLSHQDTSSDTQEPLVIEHDET
ncbi:MAG: hypothetical protein M1828_004341 [Chrysothrix sp. TS-e1954]|nr:MAG: hypothetical protein M1828_004341 [Chrysothrix sp. TS-e1954]